MIFSDGWALPVRSPGELRYPKAAARTFWAERTQGGPHPSTL
jgi:hypothetical protein